jgi:hypothetical protein
VIEALEGAGNVPAYRGVAYVVFDDLPLADYGNALPNIEFEVIVDGTADVPVMVRQYATIDTDIVPATSARLTGTTMLLGHTSDGITGRLAQLRTVIGADADEELVAAFTASTLLPSGYAVATYQASQVRNDPDIRVFNIWQLDESLDPVPGSTRTCFYYLDAYASGISSAISDTWQAAVGPFVSLSWDGFKYVYQCPSPFITAGANTTTLLSRLRLPRDQVDALAPGVESTLLPAGMTYNGNPLTEHVGTAYIAVDEERRRIVIGSVERVDFPCCVIVDGVTMEIIAIYQAIGNVVAAAAGRALVWATFGGSGYQLKVFDVSGTGGTVASPLTPTLLGAATGLSVVPTEGMPAPAPGLVMLGDQLWRYNDSVADAPPTLEEVVQRVAVRAGYDIGDVSASSLAGITVQGYVRRERMSGAAMLAPLTQAYGFDVSEVDGKLTARLRSASSDATIAWADLIGSPGEPAVSSRRAQESELPQQLDVSYFSYPADYAVGSQSAQRIVTESRQKVAVDLPIVMPDTEAAQKCRRMIYEAWIGRNSRAFQLGPKWSRLVPADVVTLPLDDDGTATATVRMTSVSRDGILLRCEAVDVDAAAFTQPDVAGDIPSGGGGSSAIAATVLALLPQLPPLRDDDASYGLYAAASSFDEGWPGAVLTMQSSSHADAFSVGSVNTRMVIGRATTVLGDWADGDARLDTRNTVDVAIECGDLPASVSVDSILEGRGNAFAIGDEVVQAMTVSVVSGNTVRLSNLWRGLQGTYASGHIDGERVVGLDAVIPIRFESSWVGNLGLMRATSFGQSADRATVGSFTFSSDRVKALPVANLRAVRLSNSDIYIDWERRARTRNIWTGGADTWLDEPSESYDIDIYNQAGSSIVRSLTSQPSSAYLYTAANIATDQAQAKPTTLNIAIYQYGTAGRGRGAMRAVSVLQPTSPLALLLHGDGANGGSTFTDSSPYVHTLTRTTGTGSITTSTSQVKFGSASIYFNGAGGATYLSMPDDPILRLGLNDFTIDFWIYRTVNSFAGFVISKRDRSGLNQGDFEFYVDQNNDGKPCLKRYTNIDGNIFNPFSTAITLSAWNHIALTRSGTTWRGFVNGVNALQFTATYDVNTQDPVYLGSPFDGSGANITQYLDELRILNGHAAWTSDFTPPGAPY